MSDFSDWMDRREDQERPSRHEGFPPEPTPAPSAFPQEPVRAFEAPPAPPMPGPPPRRRRGTVVVSALVAALVFLGAGVGLGWGLFRPTTATSPTTTRGAVGPPLQIQPSTGSTGGTLSLQGILARVEPGIVDINTYLDTSTLGSGSFGAPGPSAQPLGAGTGMVLTSSGEVLTNNHVIEGATNIEVTIPGRSGHYYAKVVGVDPTDDVALLQLQGASNLSTVTLGSSSNVHIGDHVVAIGNALGQGGTPTVTQGSVTAVGRTITVGGGPGGPEHLRGLIQTDAPISPGDSGGALANSSGQVIGIITAAQRSTDPQPSSHIGYAIAMTSAAGIVNQIRSGDASATVIIGQPGFMGVEVRNLDAAAANRLGLGVTKGALVINVFSGTPASRAGVSAGSVITAVDRQAVASADALGPIIHAHSPGDQIKLTWVDQNGTHTATLQLISGPAV